MPATAINLKNWCDTPYGDAAEAIREIDAATCCQPASAAHILHTAWTATVLLTDSGGVPDPAWLPHMARYHKLSKGDLLRVREAVEMRMRAVERSAA